MRMRPTYDAASVAWHGNENTHGLTRIQIQPVTQLSVRHRVRKLSTSRLAPTVPGSCRCGGCRVVRELYRAVLQHEEHGRGPRVQRLPLAQAACCRLHWHKVSGSCRQVFNVAAVGKFDFDYVGVENETTDVRAGASGSGSVAACVSAPMSRVTTALPARRMPS